MDEKTTININETTIKNYVATIRPEDLEIRKQLDIGYSFINQIIEIFEIRPEWDNSSKIEHIPFVKIRFYKTTQLWSLYWMRANGKWELYEPFPTATHLTKIINVLEEDKHGCFFG